MEKLSLDSDSPIRGDYKRDTDTYTPVRQTEREEAQEMGEVCVWWGRLISCDKSTLFAVGRKDMKLKLHPLIRL